MSGSSSRPDRLPTGSAHALSPLDGRYHAVTVGLAPYFSEFALMRMRCVVELEYLEALDSASLFPPLSPEERERIRTLAATFGEEDYAAIKAIEARTNHDVKACEEFLVDRLGLHFPSMIHFGLTSEDVNNLAYSRLLARFVAERQLPLLRRLIEALGARVSQWRDVAFPARTHGQKASPSTLGKEMAVFLDRLLRQYRALASFRFRGKCLGATGTGAAWRVAFPGFDWLSFSARFVSGMGLEPSLAVTQIEDHDTWAEYFALVGRINGIVRDLDVDVWLYETLGYLSERAEGQEVGSSTMPHKVNPIRFENSEGNLHIADALLQMMSRKLTHSRLQRDLSDSTITRNIGVALAHSFLAWTQTIEGLGRLEARPQTCAEDLAASPWLASEALQTILRAAGVPGAYDALKRLVRGRVVTEETLARFVDTLDVPPAVKERLNEVRVETYVGYAREICDLVIAEAREVLGGEVGE